MPGGNLPTLPVKRVVRPTPPFRTMKLCAR